MARNDVTKPVGATGLRSTWGGVDDDFMYEWRGQQKVKRIQEMIANSPIISAIQMAIEMPILDIDWTFTSDKKRDSRRLSILNDSLDSLYGSLSDHILESLLHVFYGWHTFSVNYKRVRGRVLWDEFVPLGHDTIEQWLMDDRGHVTGLKQFTWVFPTPIPYERLIHYRFRPNRNSPEGRSVLRPAWIPYYYVKNLQHIEGIAYERNGAGYPVISSPDSADMQEGGTDYNLAHKIVRNVRLDEQSGVIEPYGWKFRFEKPGEILDFGIPIARHEKRMLMSSLSQFLMLGMDNVGTQAAFEGGSDFFTMSVNAVADNIAETFTKQEIPRLLAYNGMDATGVQLEHSPAGDIDISMVSQMLQQTGALLHWSPQDEDWLRQLARMPQRVEEIEKPAKPLLPEEETADEEIPEEEGVENG